MPDFQFISERVNTQNNPLSKHKGNTNLDWLTELTEGIQTFVSENGISTGGMPMSPKVYKLHH